MGSQRECQRAPEREAPLNDDAVWPFELSAAGTIILLIIPAVRDTVVLCFWGSAEAYPKRIRRLKGPAS
jgi:hypothetical protein